MATDDTQYVLRMRRHRRDWRFAWVPLEETAAMIITGAGSVIGIQHAVLLRAAVQLPARAAG
jgi:hypothetical protein